MTFFFFWHGWYSYLPRVSLSVASSKTVRIKTLMVKNEPRTRNYAALKLSKSRRGIITKINGKHKERYVTYSQLFILGRSVWMKLLALSNLAAWLNWLVWKVRDLFCMQKNAELYTGYYLRLRLFMIYVETF